MKNILLSVVVLILLHGCSAKNITPEKAKKVETVWSISKIFGGLFLSDETKDKVKPYVDGTEKAYDKLKKNVD